MYENLFLIILGIIWMIFASIQDLRKKEIENWFSFSLIFFGILYRLFYSAFSGDWSFALNGLIGFALFFIIANLFYYSRIFAGGDAKLLMAIGVIFPFQYGFYFNLIESVYFIFLFLFLGSVYSLLFSLFLVIKNKKKFFIEYKKLFSENRKLFYISFVFSLIFLILVLLMRDKILLFIPVLIFLIPFIFIYGKAVEESCMIFERSCKKLVPGDLLYSEIKIGNRKIKPNWEGLSEKEVEFLRRYNKKITIKEGVPFVPAFLIGFIAFLILRNSSWSFFQLFYF